MNEEYIKSLYQMFDYFVDFAIYKFISEIYSDFIETPEDVYLVTQYYRFAPQERLPMIIFQRTEYFAEYLDYSILDFFPLPFTNTPTATGNSVQMNIQIKDKLDEELLNLYRFIERNFKDIAIYNKGFPLPENPFNCRFSYRKLKYEITYRTTVRAPDQKYGLLRFLYYTSSFTKHLHPQQIEISEIPLSENQVLILDKYIVYMDFVNYTFERTEPSRKEFPVYSCTVNYEVWAPYLYLDKLQYLDRNIIIQRNWQK